MRPDVASFGVNAEDGAKALGEGVKLGSMTVH